jgi:hypothetical protein
MLFMDKKVSGALVVLPVIAMAVGACGSASACCSRTGR